MWKNIYNDPVRNRDFSKGFYSGLSIILISGLGDKVFFINMVYGSMNSFFKSLGVELLAIQLINLANILIGELIPIFININYIECAAIVIFLILGLCLIVRGFIIEDKPLEQMYRDEHDKISKKNIQNNSEINKENQENPQEDQPLVNSQEEIGVFDSWWKYFITVLIGSFCEKSQIATILITSKYDFAGIWTGSAIAHFILILCALLIGKFIARYLTNKQISIVCGVMFCAYGAYFFIDKFFFKSM